MEAPPPLREARHRLESALGSGETALSRMFDHVRDVDGELVAAADEAGTSTSLWFQTLLLDDTHVHATLVWRWEVAEPGALHWNLSLSFDVPRSPKSREVALRMHDYPHAAAFVTAALQAAELDRDTVVTTPRVTLEALS